MKKSKTRAKQPHRPVPARDALPLPDSEAKAWAMLAITDPRFKIQYIIPHSKEDDDRNSLFGLFATGIQRSAQAIMAAAAMPWDIRESRASFSIMLLNRVRYFISSGVIPIPTQDIERFLSTYPSLFRVFLTSEVELADRVDQLIAAEAIPCLHISIVPGLNRHSPQELFDRNFLEPFIRKVLYALQHQDEYRSFVRSARQALEDRIHEFIKHPLPSGQHNVTTPNETTLRAYGFLQRKSDAISQPLMPEGGNKQRYIDRIRQSCEAIQKIRRDAGFHPPRFGGVDKFILALPGQEWTLKKNWRDMLKKAPPEIRKKLGAVLKSYYAMESYFESSLVSDLEEFHNNELLRFVIKVRVGDAQAFTAILSLLAAQTMTPTIRLEPRLNNIRNEVKMLTHNVRSEARAVHADWKQSRLWRRLARKLADQIDSTYIQMLNKLEPGQSPTIEGLRFVGDVPLEWMDIDGMPLGMKFDFSRIPSLPGNMAMINAIRPPIFLPLKAFQEVLVIRSFDEKDRLRNMLQGSIELVKEERDLDAINYKFVDVDTEEDFVAALKGNESAILIFDGHGTFDSETGAGTLVVGGRALDVWSMKTKCRMPPIVMFSACDTHPMDGSHGSVANAAFVLGAHAVLATTLPIHGIHAAVFNARLMLRLGKFLPMAVSMTPTLTWREVMSGMLRMSYASELLRRLTENGSIKIDRKAQARVQMAANNAINFRQANWHDAFIGKFAAESGLTSQQIRHKINYEAGLPDSLKYVQLGRPESIIIQKESPMDVLKRAQAFEEPESPQ